MKRKAALAGAYCDHHDNAALIASCNCSDRFKASGPELSGEGIFHRQKAVLSPALEEHSVVFEADLGKEIHGCTIGNESETMAGTRQRGHRDLNRCGILNVTSSELLDSTAERYPAKDSRPIDVKRIDLGCYRVS